MSNILLKNFRRPVDSSATLDAQESILVIRSPRKHIWSARGTVISESQQPNFSLYCYHVLKFKAILGLIGRYIVL